MQPVDCHLKLAAIVAGFRRYESSQELTYPRNKLR